ncbi:hypothetical protein KJ966_22620 [bacterium]|nr:hypothetical protein [bacterium]
MKQGSFTRRFVLPLLLVVGINLVSAFIYDSAAGLSPGLLRNILISVFAPLLFISLWFFAFLGPPLAYFLKARFFERFIIAFANPVIWVVSVESKLACQYCLAEMVYFFFLPWTFGVICVTCVELSLSELICRLIDNKRTPGNAKVLHPAVMLLLTGGLVGTYFGLIKGQEWVYFVVHHYKSNFL